MHFEKVHAAPATWQEAWLPLARQVFAPSPVPPVQAARASAVLHQPSVHVYLLAVQLAESE